jgi:hypothetical protein
MRLRWDGIIARLSYRFNFLAISEAEAVRHLEHFGARADQLWIFLNSEE